MSTQKLSNEEAIVKARIDALPKRVFAVRRYYQETFDGPVVIREDGIEAHTVSYDKRTLAFLNVAFIPGQGPVNQVVKVYRGGWIDVTEKPEFKEGVRFN